MENDLTEEYKGKIIKDWKIESIENKSKVKVRCLRCNQIFNKTLRSIENGVGCCENCKEGKRKEELNNKHLGETNTNSQGLIMTIIAYRDRRDIDFEFSNGDKKEHANYDYFKNGTYLSQKEIERVNKEKYVGKTKKNNYGLEMTIIEYISSQDITVKFENGKVREHVHLASFMDGSLLDDKDLKVEYYKVWKKKQDEDIISPIIGTDFESADSLTLRVLGGGSVCEIKVKCLENGIKYTYKLSDLQNKKCKGKALLKVGREFDGKDGYAMKIIDMCRLSSGTGSNIFCKVLCLDTGEGIERVRKKDIKEGRFFYEFPKRLDSIVIDYIGSSEPKILKNGLKVEILNQKGGYYDGTCDIKVIGASKPVMFKNVSYLGILQGNFPKEYIDDLVDLVISGIITGVSINDYRVRYIGKEYAFKDGEVVIIRKVYKRGNNIFADVELKESHEELKNISVYRLKNGIAENPLSKEKVGRRSIASNGQEMRIIEYSSRFMKIQFEDGVVVERGTTMRAFDEGSIANPNFSSRPYKGNKGEVGNVEVDRLAYNLKDKKVRFYFCRCNKCGMKDILNPREILLHKCNDGVVKIPQWVLKEVGESGECGC